MHIFKCLKCLNSPSCYIWSWYMQRGGTLWRIYRHTLFFMPLKKSGYVTTKSATVQMGHTNVRCRLSSTPVRVILLLNYALRHEDIWRSRCIDPRICDLGTSWDALPPGKEPPPRGPFDRRQVGTQNRSARRGEEKKFAYIGTWTSTPWPSQSVASRCTDWPIPQFQYRAILPLPWGRIRFTSDALPLRPVLFYALGLRH
jgi:hypothetical protein